MKILRISLENIASLAGLHTVDFTKDPLRSAGLFAISGPTGSGKSTLLDALCLALYNNTPRLGEASTGNIPDTAGNNTITQKNPGNLLRRGAGAGFAEVAFEGVDQEIYTARWSIQRARKKATGGLQDPEMALFSGNVPNGVGSPYAGGRRTEVLRVIKEKIGLTFAQFTRAVLLAQNDFSVFLKANDDDRSLILQALTNTEHFEKISIAVFERNKKENEEVEAIKSQLSGQAPLSEEDRKKADEDVLNAGKALSDATTELSEKQKHQAWFVRCKALMAAQEGAEKTLHDVIFAQKEAEPRRQELARTISVSQAARPLYETEIREKQQIDAHTTALKVANAKKTECEKSATEKQTRWEAANRACETAKTNNTSAVPLLLQARVLDTKIQPLQESLPACEEKRKSAEASAKNAATALATLDASITQQTTHITTLDAQQTKLVPFAPYVIDAQAWSDKLTAAQQLRNEEARGQKDFQTQSEQTNLLVGNVDKAKLALEKLHLAKEQSAGEVLSAQQALQAYDLDAMTTERGCIEDTNVVLLALKSHLEKMTRFQENLATIQKSRAENGKKIADATAQFQSLEDSSIPTAEAAFTASKEARTLAEAAADAAIPKLQAALRDNHPCPVCGGCEHPYATHPPSIVATMLSALQKQESKKANELDSFKTQATSLRTALGLYQQTDRKQATELLSVEAQLQAERSLAPTGNLAFEILALSEQERLKELDVRNSELAKSRIALEAKTKEYHAANKKLDSARKSLEEATKNLGLQEKTLTALQSQLAVAQTQKTEAEKQFKKTQQSLAAALGAVANLLAEIPDAERNFAADASKFIVSFDGKTGVLRRIQQELVAAKQLVETQTVRRAGLQTECDTAAKLLEEAQKAEKDLRESLEQLSQDRKELFAGRSVAAVESELHVAVEQTTHALTVATEENTQSQKEVAVASETVRKQIIDLTDSTQRFDQAKATLDAWIANFPTDSDAVMNRSSLLEILARDAAWVQQEQVSLQALSDAITTATGALNVHQATLTTHMQQRPTEEDEPTVLLALQACTERQSAASKAQIEAQAVILSDENRKKEGALLLKQLEAKQKTVEPWGKLDEVIGSRDGKRFRIIAQRHTLNILLGYANAQLAMLSGRYQLESLPESLSLLVKDQDMGDERRSVHSLSGGESFLVSLALALGLASLTSNRLRIESLFIDEGFGSLDADTLNTAMNALMHLESQGRKVGVISHVREMADAIPVQICIVKQPLGASTLEVK